MLLVQSKRKSVSQALTLININLRSASNVRMDMSANKKKPDCQLYARLECLGLSFKVMCVLLAQEELLVLREEREINLNVLNALLEEFVILKISITYHKQSLAQMVKFVLQELV